MCSFRKIIMTEHDWEEFKKKVTPLGKKKQLLKKNKEKIILKNLEHKEKFETGLKRVFCSAYLTCPAPK